MNKKRLIIFISIFAVLVLIAVLNSTVFTLKQIEINFYTETDQLIDDVAVGNTYINSAEKVEEIAQNEGITYGKNIFLIQKTNLTNLLEQDNPYLRIINIETIFPNKLVIKAVERKPIFCIEVTTSKFLICDEDLKVLEVLTTANADLIALTTTTTQLFLNYVEDFDEYNVGNFIAKNPVVLGVKEIVPSFYVSQYSKTMMLSLVDYIQVFTQAGSGELGAENTQCIKIKTNAGVVLEIENFTNLLENKINKALSIYNYWMTNDSTKTNYGTIKIFDTIENSQWIA